MNLATYHPAPTPLHRIDARCKIVLMLVFSVALFFVHTWAGIAALALLFVLAAWAARLNLVHALRQLLPIVFVLAATLVANAFTFDALDPGIPAAGVAPAGALEAWPAVPLVGSFGFWPAGFARGCFYALRIVLLVGASLALTTTTTATQLTQAIESFLGPLGKVGFPARDAATVVSIALRFIPVTIDEFHEVRAAQTARAAQFDTGPLVKRLQAWKSVLVPWFVGLYRRADDLASAMDARCYGACAATHLNQQRITRRSAVVLALGVACCIVVAAVL